MANPIDLIITQEAVKAIDIVIGKIDVLDKKLQDTAQSFIESSKKIASATNSITPTTVNNKGEDAVKLNADLDKLKAKYVSLNDAVQKKLEQTRLAEIRLQQAREKAFDSFDRNAKKEEAALKKAEGAYQRIQNSVTLLTKTYNDLAIRKELGNTLSAKEEKQLTTLSSRINQYQTALKNTDSQIGKNTRNVGNYASGYNALGNSINQLSREAPAFANSINTGFMALSNNFPALFDAISGIREQNRLLVAEGKPTKSLFSQLVNGVFSLQTALSLGVTMLTLYGGTFVKWIQEVAKGKEGVNELKLRIDTLNKAFEDTGVANAVKNVNELTINIDLAKRGFLDKKKVVEQYNETIGKTTGLVTSLDEAERELTKNGDAYIKMTLYKAAANIALEEASKQVLEAEKSRRKSLEDFSNAFLDADLTQTRSKEQYNAKQANLQRQRENRQKEEIKINEDAAKANIDIAKKFQEDAAKIASQFGFNFFQDTKEEKAIEDALKAKYDAAKKELELQALKQEVILNGETNTYKEQYNALEKYLDLKMQIITLDYNEQVRLAKGNADKIKSADLDMQMAIIKQTQDGFSKIKTIRKKENDERIQEIKDVEAFLKKYHDDEQIRVDAQQALDEKVAKAKRDLIDKEIAKLKELKLATKDYTDSFIDEFASGAGMSETFNTFIKTFDDGTGKMTTKFKQLLEGADSPLEKFQVYFNAIAQSAQEAFNFITQASQENFDAEKQRLQAQYDIAIKFAGDSDSAKKKLEDDLEKRQKEIAYREAKAKQKQAIFNIAIDTAQAVVASLPNFYLAAIVAAFGIAQAVVVSSQEIPQYWMGGTHDGGLMMVNDGKESNYKETVVTPDGKIMKPQGRNIIMNAPKGTEIYTNDQWSEKVNEMLQGKGIDMLPQQNTYSGITKGDMYDAMMDAFGEQPQYHSNFDAEGASTYVLKKGNKTTEYTNRGNSKKRIF